jgi:antitoxin StbD
VPAPLDTVHTVPRPRTAACACSGSDGEPRFKRLAGELIREATDEDVVVARHGRLAAVLVGAERYDALLEELEDLKDRLSVYESAGTEPTLRIGFGKMAAELGAR